MPITTRAPRLVTIAFTLLVALALLPLVGCNVVDLTRDRYVYTLTSAGLRPGAADLGADHLSYWQGSAEPEADAERPTVLLLPGFGGGAMWAWHPQVADLTPHFEVIAPDLLWFGDSTSTDDDRSLAHQVDAVVALLDVLGEREVHIVGLSYGGMVGYELAIAHPERVASLTLVDCPGRVINDEDRALVYDTWQVPDYATLLLPVDADGVAQLLELAYANPPWAPDWAKKQAVEGLYGVWRDERAGLLDAIHAPGALPAPRPDEIAVPTLLVWGRDDPVYPLPIGERLQRHVGNGTRLEVIEDARHAPNLEHPDAFNPLVVEFIQSQHARRTAAEVTPEGSPRP